MAKPQPYLPSLDNEKYLIIKPNVKSISMWNYHFYYPDGKNLKQDSTLGAYEEYDKQGYIIFSEMFNADKTVNRSQRYFYDEQERILQIKYYSSDSILNAEEKFIRTPYVEIRDVFDYKTKAEFYLLRIAKYYNDSGTLIRKEIKYFHKDSLLYYYQIFHYDNNAKLLALEEKDYRTNKENNGVYLKDEKGRMVGWGETRNGKLERIVTNIYNDSGDLIESFGYMRGNTWNRKYDYKYNELGNKIEILEWRSDTLCVEKITFEYNKKQQLTEKNYFEPTTNQLERREIYVYDSKGFLIKKIEILGVDSIKNETVYKYDNNDRKIETLLHAYSGKLYYKADTLYSEESKPLRIIGEKYYYNLCHFLSASTCHYPTLPFDCNIDTFIVVIETKIFDEKGKIIKTEMKSSDKNNCINEERIVKYDEYFNVTEESMVRFGNVSSVTRYKYEYWE